MRYHAVGFNVIDKDAVEAGGFDKAFKRFTAFVNIDVLVELRLKACVVDDALPRSFGHVRVRRDAKGSARIGARADLFAGPLGALSTFFFVGAFHVCELVDGGGGKVPDLFHVRDAAQLRLPCIVVA